MPDDPADLLHVVAEDGLGLVGRDHRGVTQEELDACHVRVEGGVCLPTLGRDGVQRVEHVVDGLDGLLGEVDELLGLGGFQHPPDLGDDLGSPRPTRILDQQPLSVTLHQIAHLDGLDDLPGVRVDDGHFEERVDLNALAKERRLPRLVADGRNVQRPLDVGVTHPELLGELYQDFLVGPRELVGVERRVRVRLVCVVADTAPLLFDRQRVGPAHARVELARPTVHDGALEPIDHGLDRTLRVADDPLDLADEQVDLESVADVGHVAVADVEPVGPLGALEFDIGAHAGELLALELDGLTKRRVGRQRAGVRLVPVCYRGHELLAAGWLEAVAALLGLVRRIEGVALHFEDAGIGLVHPATPCASGLDGRRAVGLHQRVGGECVADKPDHGHVALVDHGADVAHPFDRRRKSED